MDTTCHSVGALGSVSKDFEKSVEHLRVDLNFSTLQGACLLRTARLLRRRLDSRGRGGCSFLSS